MVYWLVNLRFLRACWCNIYLARRVYKSRRRRQLASLTHTLALGCVWLLDSGRACRAPPDLRHQGGLLHSSNKKWSGRVQAEYKEKERATAREKGWTIERLAGVGTGRLDADRKARYPWCACSGGASIWGGTTMSTLSTRIPDHCFSLLTITDHR